MALKNMLCSASAVMKRSMTVPSAKRGPSPYVEPRSLSVSKEWPQHIDKGKGKTQTAMKNTTVNPELPFERSHRKQNSQTDTAHGSRPSRSKSKQIYCKADEPFKRTAVFQKPPPRTCEQGVCKHKQRQQLTYATDLANPMREQVAQAKDYSVSPIRSKTNLSSSNYGNIYRKQPDATPNNAKDRRDASAVAMKLKNDKIRDGRISLCKSRQKAAPKHFELGTSMKLNSVERRDSPKLSSKPQEKRPVSNRERSDHTQSRYELSEQQSQLSKSRHNRERVDSRVSAPKSRERLVRNEGRSDHAQLRYQRSFQEPHLQSRKHNIERFDGFGGKIKHNNAERRYVSSRSNGFGVPTKDERVPGTCTPDVAHDINKHKSVEATTSRFANINYQKISTKNCATKLTENARSAIPELRQYSGQPRASDESGARQARVVCKSSTQRVCKMLYDEPDELADSDKYAKKHHVKPNSDPISPKDSGTSKERRMEDLCDIVAVAQAKFDEILRELALLKEKKQADKRSATSRTCQERKPLYTGTLALPYPKRASCHSTPQAAAASISRSRLMLNKLAAIPRKHCIRKPLIGAGSLAAHISLTTGASAPRQKKWEYMTLVPLRSDSSSSSISYIQKSSENRSCNLSACCYEPSGNNMSFEAPISHKEPASPEFGAENMVQTPKQEPRNSLRDDTKSEMLLLPGELQSQIKELAILNPKQSHLDTSNGAREFKYSAPTCAYALENSVSVIDSESMRPKCVVVPNYAVSVPDSSVVRQRDNSTPTYVEKESNIVFHHDMGSICRQRGYSTATAGEQPDKAVPVDINIVGKNCEHCGPKSSEPYSLLQETKRNPDRLRAAISAARHNAAHHIAHKRCMRY